VSGPRILIVGAGNMGSAHARVVASHPLCQLEAIVDPDVSNGPIVAARYGTSWRPDLGDLTDIDGVILAAPTPLHHRIGLDLIAAGIPVLIEKPLADTLEGTRALLDAASAAGVPIMCGFVERFNPAVVTAMALLSAPVHVQAIRHSPYAARIKTGVTWDLLVHDVDLSLRILGHQVTSVTAVKGAFAPQSDPAAEDVLDATIGFANGTLASISASRISQRKVRSLSIFELDRLIEVDLLRRDVTVYRNVSTATAELDGRGYRQQAIIEIPEPTNSVEPLVGQFDHFLSLIAGRVDADAERASILPAHLTIAAIEKTAATTLIG